MDMGPFGLSPQDEAWSKLTSPTLCKSPIGITSVSMSWQDMPGKPATSSMVRAAGNLNSSGLKANCLAYTEAGCID